MKKLLFFMFAMLVCPNLHAQKLQVRVDSLSASINLSNIKIENIEESINGLSRQVESLSYLVEAQKEIISQEQSAIENSMGAINTMLTLFSILIAIGGIVLGWFINRKEKNVKSLLSQVEAKKDEVEKLEEKTAQTKRDIVELNNTINDDIEGLYEKLRREETVTYLKRLVHEPNDVGNVLPLLLSRDLVDNDLKYLFTAYRNLENKEDNGILTDGLFMQRLSSKGQYLLLFYQHFCGQALCYKLTSNDLAGFFPALLSCAFKNDVINSTTSLVKYFNREDVMLDRVEILYKYLNALHKSKYSDMEEPYSVIVSKYRNDEELKNVWERLDVNNIYIPIFNGLMYGRFNDDMLFIEKLEAQKKKAEQAVETIENEQYEPNCK